MAIYLPSNEFNKICNNPKNKVKGRVNRQNGLSFEKKVIFSCEYYSANHIAAIEKTPEPMKIIGTDESRKGLFKAVFEKKAQPDFKGTLNNGRCVLFEAKHTTSNYISKKVVLEVQSNKLNQYESLGALCFVLVSFNFENYYRIPWTVWINMENIFGKAYLKEIDIQKYKIPHKDDFIDFLYGYNLDYNLEIKNEYE